MSLAAVGASWLGARSATAEPSDGQAGPSATEEPPAEHDVRLGFGTGLTLGLSDMEERFGDTVTITGSAFHLNLHISPSYQLTPRWALGLRGSWASDAGARGMASSSGEQVDKTRNLWQLTAEGRYQPGTQRGPYVAGSAGYAGAVDSVGSASAWQWAPLVGGALGYDFPVADIFSLGLELRGAYALFDDEGASLTRGGQSERYVYGSSSWLSLNVMGQLGL